jgi:hypothetical protein
MGDPTGQRRFSGQRQHFSHFPAVDVPFERPFPVTLIALFQFAKAWFLLLVVVIARVVPDALRSVPGLSAFLYFAAHGRDTRGPLLPLVGVSVALIGCGLWRLWRWARRSLIFSSGLMVALWAYRFFNDWTAGQVTFRTPLEEQAVYFLVFLDLVIVAYLAFYDGVPQAFEEARF